MASALADEAVRIGLAMIAIGNAGRRSMPAMSFVGRSVSRLEDRALLTGNGRFAADVVHVR